MTPISSPWLTVQEGARYLKLGPKVVYAECRRGKLRHAVVGGRRTIRLRREWLDEFLERTAPIVGELR